VRYAFPGGNLHLGDPDVIEELRPIEHGLILPSIHEHRGTSSVLGEDDRSLGFLHLAYDGGQVGAEVGEGADVLCRADAGHEAASLVMYTIMYITEPPARQIPELWARRLSCDY
jgi:hypothetical protein